MTTQLTQVALSGTVQANGQQLYYEIHGDGPPLVLLMGIGYDSSLWTLAQVPALSTRFQVVLMDNRDAGRSSRADHPYRIADMADGNSYRVAAPDGGTVRGTGDVLAKRWLTELRAATAGRDVLALPYADHPDYQAEWAP